MEYYNNNAGTYNKNSLTMQKKNEDCKKNKKESTSIDLGTSFWEIKRLTTLEDELENHTPVDGSSLCQT